MTPRFPLFLAWRLPLEYREVAGFPSPGFFGTECANDSFCMSFSDKYKAYTDDQLIERYRQSRDKKWVGVIYQRYAHLVYGVCLKYFQHVEKSKDQTGNIFEELFDKLLNHDIDNFSSWLYAFSKNHCLMHLRKTKTNKHGVNLGNHQSIEDLILTFDDSALRQKIEREQLYEHLEKAILHLKENQRECIRYFYLENMNYSQVAEKTGLTLSKVKSAIQNGKRNLKNMLINQK